MNIKDLVFYKAKYSFDNTLAIECYLQGECYCRLTVNLHYDEKKHYEGGDYKQYVDSNNVDEEIIQQLVDAGKIKPTGIYEQSGFCQYELYEFDKEWVDNMKEFER